MSEQRMTDKCPYGTRGLHKWRDGEGECFWCGGPALAGDMAEGLQFVSARANPIGLLEDAPSPADQLRALAAACYQMAGVAGAPRRFLDALAAAAAGRPFIADPVGLLPVTEDEFSSYRPQPSRLSDDDRRAAFMAGWRAYPEHDGDSQMDAAYVTWLAQRPEAQPLAALDHARDGDA
jgi:hypothetical protein